MQDDAQAAGSVEFWNNYFFCRATHKPLDLVDDITTLRTTFLEARQKENCFDACQARGLACQRHWFDVLNNCDALKAAFPEHTHCSTGIYIATSV